MMEEKRKKLGIRIYGKGRSQENGKMSDMKTTPHDLRKI